MPKFNNKLGMSALISHPEKKSIDEQMQIFAAVGFDSFFLSCGVTYEFDEIPYWAACARGAGIDFEAVHAPHDLVDAVWLGTEASHQYQGTMMRIIDLCAEGGVEKLVLHTGNDPKIAPNERGLSVFRTLEDYATSRGVTLCYENANTPALFEAVVSSASAPHGFCHDIGHQLCYTRDKNYISPSFLSGASEIGNGASGDKIKGAAVKSGGTNDKIGANNARNLLYTHIHDNLGDGRDLHLLPGDGIQDWRAYFDRLSSIGYRGTLNLELSCYHRPDYCQMTFEGFAKAAHKRLTNMIYDN